MNTSKEGSYPNLIDTIGLLRQDVTSILTSLLKEIRNLGSALLKDHGNTPTTSASPEVPAPAPTTVISSPGSSILSPSPGEQRDIPYATSSDLPQSSSPHNLDHPNTLSESTATIDDFIEEVQSDDSLHLNLNLPTSQSLLMHQTVFQQ